MTILSSGRRSATSSTDSNCSALMGMASKASRAAARSLSDSTTPSCSNQRGSGSLLMRWRTPTSLPRPQPVERARSGVGIGQRQPADDAAHEIDLAAEIEAFLGLAADLVQDLHQHRALDAGALELRAQVVGGEIAREAVADESGPAIGVPAGPPEMMMRVDHGSIGCPSGWRSSD